MVSAKFILTVLYAIGAAQAALVPRAFKALDIRCDCNNPRTVAPCCPQPKIEIPKNGKHRRFISGNGESNQFSVLTTDLEEALKRT
jgi:hypothetical protein